MTDADRKDACRDDWNKKFNYELAPETMRQDVKSKLEQVGRRTAR